MPGKIHWRCFHCGDTFTKAQKLARHVGTWETYEDPRLIAAGVVVTASAAGTQWHYRIPRKQWVDGFKSERAAVRAALRALSPTAPEGQG